jgi:hypothetical protein
MVSKAETRLTRSPRRRAPLRGGTFHPVGWFENLARLETRETSVFLATSTARTVRCGASSSSCPLATTETVTAAAKKRRDQISARLDPEISEIVHRVAEVERPPVSNLLRNIVSDWAKALHLDPSLRLHSRRLEQPNGSLRSMASREPIATSTRRRSWPPNISNGIIRTLKSPCAIWTAARRCLAPGPPTLPAAVARGYDLRAAQSSVAPDKAGTGKSNQASGRLTAPQSRQLALATRRCGQRSAALAFMAYKLVSVLPARANVRHVSMIANRY